MNKKEIISLIGAILTAVGPVLTLFASKMEDTPSVGGGKTKTSTQS